MNTASVSSVTKPEFIVYSFEKDEVSKGSPVWQAHKILDDEAQACRIADALFINKHVTRVEVRRRGDDGIIKICDAKSRKFNKLNLMLSGAAFCIVSAALITIYQ